MSENTGFRVSLFFNLFFKDQKSRSSVYVNLNRCKTVQGLKEHISNLFNVPHGDFDLHCANNFLPPGEDIRVLKPDDTVLIVPNNLESIRKRKKSIRIVEVQTEAGENQECSADTSQENVVKPRSKIKRKRSNNLIEPKDCISDETSSPPKQAKIENKKQRKQSIALIESENDVQAKPKESSNKKVKLPESKQDKEVESQDSSTVGYSTIEKINFFEHLTHSTESNSEKAKDAMLRCSLAKCSNYNNTENALPPHIQVEDSPLKETPTFISNRRKRTSTPYYQPIGTLLTELKRSSVKIEECDAKNDGIEVDNSSVKKRKRYRKRKRPTVKFNTENNSESPIEPPLILPPVTQPVQRTHIKFSDNVEIIPDGNSVAITKLLLTPFDNCGNSTDSAIEVIEVTSSAGSVDAAVLIETVVVPSMTLTSIMTSPSMKNIAPKSGDLIAFKMLRLTDSYTPELSQYITAKTVYYDVLSRSISLQIIEGGEQMQVPNGKFSLDMLEGMEEKGQLSEEMTINWDQLIDPRLLYP